MSITTTVIAKEAREAREELKKELSGDCVDYNVKRDRPVSKECSDKNFLETYGISKEQYRANVMKELEKDHKSDLTIALERRAESDANFLKTWGISKDDFYEQAKKDAKQVREDFERYEEIREDMARYDRYEQEKKSEQAFKDTWGMSKEEMNKKILAEVEAQRIHGDKINETIDKAASILDQYGEGMEEFEGVFTKADKKDSLDANSTKSSGIDSETLDRLRKEIDERENTHDTEFKNHDTIKGPSLPSMDFIK